jgi:predicted O-methyltransferase YrrM
MKTFDQLSQWSHAYRVPCISPETKEFLIETCLKHKPVHCCEIGTARGVSACTIGTILQTWKGKLITTEITYPDYRIACDTLSQNQLMGTVTPIYADALKISWERILTEQLDFLFVDGQKRQYGEYLERLWPFLRK